MPYFKQNLRWEKGIHGPGFVTPEYFGAKGDGSDDTVALSNAFDQLTSDGGGTLLLGPYNYFHTGLVLPGSCSIKGVPDASFLVTNHATANSLVCIGTQLGPPCVVEDVRFISNVSNSGRAVTNNSDAHVQFVRCGWNGYTSGGGPTQNLKGNLGRVGTSEGLLEYIDCRIEVGGLVDGLYALNGGQIKVRGGSIKMPASYSASLINVDTDSYAEVSTLFDCRGHSSNPTGHGRCVYATSSAARINIYDSIVDVTGVSATVDGFGWLSGTPVHTSNINYVGTNVTKYFTNSLAANGSRIDVSKPTAQSVTGTSLSCETGIAGKSFIQTAGGSPTITLPFILFEGQEFDLTYFNLTGGPLGISVANYGMKASQPTVGNNTGITARFRAMDHHAISVPTWTQIGGWGAVSL